MHKMRSSQLRINICQYQPCFVLDSISGDKLLESTGEEKSGMFALLLLQMGIAAILLNKKS